MRRVLLEETPSTNTWLKQQLPALDDDCWVRAVTQTAGRGQRGNRWEAEPGMNLTFSFLCRHAGIPANENFAVSEATALAVADMLENHGIPAAVKWPNDIYAGGDRKICGILIENGMTGTRLDWSIIGAGINVNQTEFLSDAPNPVSMAQIAGREFSLEELEAEMQQRLQRAMAEVATPEGRREVHRRYLQRLWRREVMAPYRDAESGELFQARILDVEPSGYLHLIDHLNQPRRYAFKEVVFL